MPGKLGKNLRSGHLAEDIGILFLRNFCAVAAIRQEDDHGTDAIATLLRQEGGLLFAEDSFLVQIKSSSITEIKYSGDEIKWLLNQDLPFFLCSVNKKEQQISIYTTNPIYQIILHPEVESIKLVFEDLPDENHDRIKVEGSNASFLLGPPIIKASEGYSRTDEFAEKAYMLMKDWVKEEKNQMSFRKLGRTRIARWKTWETPDYFGTIIKGASNNIKRDLTEVKPYFEYLCNHLVFTEEGSKHEESLAFLILKKWYEKYEIEVDFNERILSDKIKWPDKDEYLPDF